MSDNVKYNQILSDFLNGDNREARRYFARKGYELEAAYSKIIDDDLKGAKQIFLKLRDKDLRADFGYTLVDILQSNPQKNQVYSGRLPKFFQIRNFLEVDLNILIKHRKGDYVERLCSYSGVLAQINSETYKYFSRAFFFNNYLDFALNFAIKAKNYFYNDAELHYHMALIMLFKNDKVAALECCKNCLRIADNYYPAKNLFRILTEG